MIATATLGRSGVAVSTLGVGGAPIGNLYAPVSDGDARGALDAAWQAGVRFFDTAPHYGLGLSERRLGAALAARPRDRYTVSTKVGRLLEPAGGTGDDLAEGFAVPATHRRRFDFGRDAVLRSLEGSLRRLGLDRVDVLLLHDPDDHWEQAIGSGLPALADLRAEGVVGAVGVGMNQWPMPLRFVEEADLDVVLLAGRYTLLDQSALAHLLPACAARNVSVVAAGVLGTGLLATATPAPDATYEYRAAPRDVRERATRIAAVCARHGVPLPRAAVRFPFGHPAVAAVVVGVRSAAELAAHAAAFAAPLPAALWADLRAGGLLAPGVPVPP